MPDLVVGSASWAQQALPDKPHPNEPIMYVDGDAALGKQPFVFLGGPVLLDATITTGLLKLFTAGVVPAGGPFTITAERVVAEWSADDLTWNTRPAIDATHAATVNVPSATVAGVEFDLDLAPMLGDVAAGGPMFGVRLRSNAAGSVPFYAPGTVKAELKPVLSLEYRLPLDAPTNLNLGGGKATSLAKPVLGWEFGPPDDVESSWQAKCRVQISTDGVTWAGGPLVYDSGLVANTLQQFDLANPPGGAPAFAGLADGDVRYWRVQVQDDKGVLSEWSEVA